MTDQRASLEVIAPTVEEALAKGLSDLGLPREAVEVEILDEGSRGLFGIGSRHARIRLTIKSSIEEGRTPKPVEAPVAYPPSEAARQPGPAAEAVSPSSTAEATAEADDEPAVQIARETVSELLEKMSVRAKVSAQMGVAEDARSKVPILVDITGNDLSFLIGRQAETLNALQYIASLIIGKELQRSIPVVIDVEGYRKRREQQIRQLARRMADQAIKTGRRQMLEPMPANERRIVHLELREHPQVTTESIGEDPRRKVTIIPK